MFETGDIKAGLPPVQPPSFSFNRATANGTEVIGFGAVASELGAAIGLIPLIAILEQIAIAKAFGIQSVNRQSQQYLSMTRVF